MGKLWNPHLSIPEALAEQVMAAVRAANIQSIEPVSISAWVRQAIREKLERDNG